MKKTPIAQTTVNIPRQVLFDAQLSSTQKVLLCVLYAVCDEGVTNGELALLLGLTASNVSKALSALHLGGYLDIAFGKSPGSPTRRKITLSFP